MSGSARRRGGRGRGRAGQPPDTSSGRGVPSGPAAPPGAFDGPASRGSASGPPGSTGRGGSNVPSVASVPQSGGESPQPPQGAFTPTPGVQGGGRVASAAGAPQAAQAPRGDPAREVGSAPRYTDQLRNIDLPASFYNFDNIVSFYPSPCPGMKSPRL